MYDDFEQVPEEKAGGPLERAREKVAELRMHAEFAAVFEGPRKFGATVRPSLKMSTARDVQKAMLTLDKAKEKSAAAGPVLPPEEWEEAEKLLKLGDASGLEAGDYHVYRRPGEVMMVRWLGGPDAATGGGAGGGEGTEVETFYRRMQAHFDVAFEDFREDEKSSLGWRKDKSTGEYLEALEKYEVKVEKNYLRGPIREWGVAVLSTWTVDEMDILHLCEHLMGVSPAEIVGDASAPTEEPTHEERAWFFRMFALRGLTDVERDDKGRVTQGTERMCFFTYLQKAGDEW